MKRYATRRSIGLGFIATLLVGCGGSDTPAPAPSPAPVGRPPTIAAFVVNPAAIEVGAAAVLQWSVNGAESIAIDQGIGPIRGGAILQVRPALAGSITYTLSASNPAGTSTASISLAATTGVTPPPSPTAAQATFAGFSAILISWDPQPQASGYSISWSSTTSPLVKPLATIAGDRYWHLHTGTNANELYSYEVRALNDAGASAAAAASSISAPILEAPAPPQVTPATAQVAPGATLHFTANEPSFWRLLDGPGAGTIDQNGLYIAPAAAGVYYVAVRGRNTAIVPVTVH